MKNIETVWQNILAHEGETFYTVSGLPFTYVVENNNRIRPYRENSEKWALTKQVFEKALTYSDFFGKDFNKEIIGPSYVRGILEDSRI